jgi:hypothetical protein
MQTAGDSTSSGYHTNRGGGSVTRWVRVMYETLLVVEREGLPGVYSTSWCL